LRKSETDENCRVSRRIVRKRRATESRNSGSSSMTKTLGFASLIAGIPKRELVLPAMALIVRTID